MSERPVFRMKKKKFPNSSCLTYILQDMSAEETDKLPFSAEIRLPEQDYKPVEGAPLIAVILALEGGHYSIDEPYVKAVLQTGANIRLISYKNAAKQLHDADGLLLVGGFFPTPDDWYLHPPAEKTPFLPPRTLAYLDVIAYACQKHLPMFGVCGGMQMMAGFRGGKLMNIAQDFGYTPLQHKGINANEYAHEIKIEKSSQLAGICGVEKASVNSAHGEAVAEVPAESIKISAKAADGIIEAIEYVDYPGYALGVQWHPERMAVQGEILSKNLYQRLTDEARHFRLRKQAEEAC